MISARILIRELELDELLDQPARVIDRGAEQEKYQLEDQIIKNRPDLLGIVPALDGCHDAIDDQLADPSLSGRQQSSGQRENSQIPAMRQWDCLPNQA